MNILAKIVQAISPSGSFVGTRDLAGLGSKNVASTARLFAPQLKGSGEVSSQSHGIRFGKG